MSIPVRTPKTWPGVLAALFRNSRHKESGKWRAYIAFRGVARDWGPDDLKTSLQRMPEDPGASPGDKGSLEWVERRLLDNLLKYERSFFRPDDTEWDALLIGQHHGLPTRLLDWSHSPLVALFVACQDAYEKDAKDGLVWCVNRLRADGTLPKPLQDIAHNRGTSTFTLPDLRDLYPKLKKFDDTVPGSTLLFFEPPSLSPRIAAQYALFSLMPGVRTRLLPFLKKHPTYAWKVVIPQRLKKEIRERLMIMNVSERALFPGLDGTCQFLKAWYQR